MVKINHSINWKMICYTILVSQKYQMYFSVTRNQLNYKKKKKYIEVISVSYSL